MIGIAAGFTGNAQPLDMPRIGWRRIAGTVSASSAAAGFAAANAATDRTDSFWQGTTLPATWAVDAGAGVAVSYCGIAGHDLGSKGCTVTVQSSPDGSTWTDRIVHAPSDDSAIFLLFATATVRHWRVRITGSGGVPVLAHVRFGAVTEFPQRAAYAPSVSFERTRQVTFDVNLSEGGQWLGRSRKAVALAPVMEVAHLSEAWMVAEFDAFAVAAEVAPFFVADRPSKYPASCAYALTKGALNPGRTLAKATASHSVTLQLQGFMA